MGWGVLVPVCAVDSQDSPIGVKVRSGAGLRRSTDAERRLIRSAVQETGSQVKSLSRNRNESDRIPNNR